MTMRLGGARAAALVALGALATFVFVPLLALIALPVALVAVFVADRRAARPSRTRRACLIVLAAGVAIEIVLLLLVPGISVKHSPYGPPQPASSQTK